MNKLSVKQIVLAAFFLALGLILPFFTMQIPSIGSMLLPMHIPVILCGFVCGGPLGAIVGFIVPLLRSALFTMPPMYPTAVAMAFELAAYGLISGILYNRLSKNVVNTYISLVVAMLGGRVVWGIVSVILYGLASQGFTFAIFIAGAFTTAIPGIILQLVLIPAIVIALQKAHLID
ncbi:ECF transporter S component [Thomasclavelia sp.]|uniref:ECF transporter S component n=1 Tax=Thomasclavelia sp. TaxID=3025757 RepID=UPI0025F42BD1|nr:ECF transporter S component [Thomasclavelia sp.]